MNTKQLTFVREYLGISQTELASKIPGLSQSNLSKFEKGVGPLSEDVINRIIEYLKFPKDFYSLNICNKVENAHYRKKATVGKKEKCKIELYNKILGYIIDEMAESIEYPPLNIKTIDLEDGYTPEYAALFTRRFMGIIGTGPIKDINKLFENHGIIVLEQDYDTENFDGVSFITDKGFYVIIVNKNFSNDRKRLTLAHELGHIIMHLSPETPIPEYRDREKEAFKFAAEFLMPEEEIRNSLEGLKLSYLIPLKKYWLTSMASIIRRAKDLNCITSDKYTYLNVELSRKGYKKQEPIEVYLDSPTVFYTAYKLLKTELKYSEDDMAKAFLLPRSVIRRVFENNNSSVKLRIVY
jgi:Zn-dependent peptidase ImmA (M78 family)/DNA-binding XRE family transcriptional regulator